MIDAGIPLKEYVIACSSSLGNGDIPLIDVSHLEETMGGSNLTIAALPLSGQVKVIFIQILFLNFLFFNNRFSFIQISLLEMSQKFHIDHLPKVLNEAMNGCQQIYKILDDSIKVHLTDVGTISGWGKLEF